MYWYQFFTYCEELRSVLHSVKFTKCEFAVLQGFLPPPLDPSMRLGHIWSKTSKAGFLLARAETNVEVYRFEHQL